MREEVERPAREAAAAARAAAEADSEAATAHMLAEAQARAASERLRAEREAAVRQTRELEQAALPRSEQDVLAMSVKQLREYLAR